MLEFQNTELHVELQHCQHALSVSHATIATLQTQLATLQAQLQQAPGVGTSHTTRDVLCALRALQSTLRGKHGGGIAGKRTAGGGGGGTSGDNDGHVDGVCANNNSNSDNNKGDDGTSDTDNSRHSQHNSEGHDVLGHDDDDDVHGVWKNALGLLTTQLHDMVRWETCW